MENAVEALKIAFAVMMFVLALTLCISSFSQASLAIDAIISMRDRENEYTYVEPTDGLYRTVGIDAVVSAMYRALDEYENTEIHFKNGEYKADGSIDIEKSINSDSIPLFYEINETKIHEKEYFVKDNMNQKKEVCSIDDEIESPMYKKLYLDVILGGETAIESALIETFGDGDDTKEKRNDYKEAYKNKIKDHYPQGLYEAFKNEEFIEVFGEYYQGEGAGQIKKGVITYILQ